MATFSRLREKRNSAPRGMSSALDVVMVKNTTGRLSSLELVDRSDAHPTGRGIGIRWARSRCTWSLYGATTMKSPTRERSAVPVLVGPAWSRSGG